jgi:hypothetical protein
MMSKLKVSFLLFFITIAFIAKAQNSIGLEAGISAGRIATNISNRVSTSVDYDMGYSVDVPLQFKLKNWLYLQTIPNITQKNYFLDRTDSLAGAYAGFINTYVQLPVELKAVYGKRLQFFGDAGFYAAYWVSAKQKGVVPNIFGVEPPNSNGYAIIQYVGYDEKYSFNSKKDNRLELGWVAGAGAQYHLNNKYMLIASARFYQSLSDQQKKYINEIPKYNQTFTFTAGAMMSFR